MKAIIIALALAVCASALTELEYQNKFTQWAAENHKVYPLEAVFSRYNVWRANMEFIERVNAENRGYTLGMNDMGDLSIEEFRSRLGYKPHENKEKVQWVPSGNAPDAVDWRTQGAVNPVRDQGQCGSCWAFSVVGSLEGFCKIKTGTLFQLAEQELVDCDKKDQGCNGGMMEDGFNYVKSAKGLANRSEYPYTARDGTCKAAGKTHNCAVQGYVAVAQNNEVALKEAVALGPVSVAIEADTSVFQFYRSGVLDSSACGTNLDHGVTAVGYGNLSGKDMWIVRNSWGSSWGASGYVYIKRTSSTSSKGICGIAMDADYPKF